MSERISGMTTLRCAAFFFFVAAWLGGARAGASPLPKAPLPAAPFPKIVTDAPTISFVAPGVTYGFYEMVTADGPLAVRVVAVDLHDPSVSLQTALASNELTSNGETVSAMAQRTGAVAGINGDYFDIGATNQPTNILVENGSLLHLPRPRYALAVTARRTVLFKQFTFGASLQLPDGTYAQLDGVNALPPPEDGTAILTPEFGPVAPEQNLTLAALEPLGGTPPFARYRVTGIDDNTVTQPPGYYLAVGLDAYGTVGALGAGSTIEAEDDTTPSLAGVVAAVGGGPLLVKDGMPYDDPDGPSGGGFADPIPCSGAAVTAAGTLLLFEVDGRQPALSIGLTRPQFAALMLAFGATEGMAFDGGGSSTLVARRLGYAGAVLRNAPSDGSERPVADGLFVYSHAPLGPPARLAVTPQTIRAFVGATVPLHVATTDAGGHLLATLGAARFSSRPATLGSANATAFVAGATPETGILRVARGNLSTEIPVRVFDAAARVEIFPHTLDLPPGGRAHLVVRAFDRRGYPIALPERVAWNATAGRVSGDGLFVAGSHDAVVTARLGTSAADAHVFVGQHERPLDIAARVRFVTYPRGDPGGLAPGTPCPECIALRYDFTGGERAAYMAGPIALPAGTIGLRMNVLGDGNGEVLRAAFASGAYGRALVTVARITWTGWRSVSVRLPPSLQGAATLQSLYVVSRFGGAPVVVAGSIAIRNVRTTLAGSGPSPRN